MHVISIIRRRLARRKRWLLLGFLLITPPLLYSCSGVIGHAIVSPPNAGKSLDEVRDTHSPPAAEPAGTVIDQRLYLELASADQPDPAPVWLSLWIIDPSNEELIDDERGIYFHVPDGSPRTRRNPTAGTLLVLHGYYHDKNRYPYLLWARILAQQGYRTILVDSRGHGGSTGDTTTFAAQEARDLVEIIDQLERRQLIVGELGVFGASLGGVTAIRLASLDPRVKAVVSVSAFSRFTDVVPSFSKGLFGWAVPLRWLINEPAIARNAMHSGKFTAADADTTLAIQFTHAPVLLIHSENDVHVPPEQARAIADANPEMTRLLLLDGGGHFNFGVTDITPIREATLSHFGHHLQPETPRRSARSSRNIR
ncbi:MAG: alpha/beta fold hydrolase [Planctomycetota bacterium]